VEHEHTVQIDADPDTVWQVLMDVRSWPEWTASMTWLLPVEPKPLAEGSEVQVKQPRLKATVWTITAFDAGRSFTWRNSGAGVTTEADHELVPTPDGTSVTLRIRQSGWLSGLSGLVGGAAIRKYVAMEADGLKARAEERVTPG
jgi:uncharacterized protein YndB with AHSA1/START domain